MLKSFKYLFIFIIILLVFTTCKKYPEDKFISFTTVKMRLEGEWQLERIEINDENVGYKYSDSLAPLTFKDYKFWFKFGWQLDKNSKETEDLFVINKSSKNATQAIEELDVSAVAFGTDPKKNKTLNIVSGSRLKIVDSFSHKILTNLLSKYFWNIRMLYQKNLIIEKTEADTKFRIFFKKIRNK